MYNAYGHFLNFEWKFSVPINIIIMCIFFLYLSPPFEAVKISPVKLSSIVISKKWFSLVYKPLDCAL